LDNNLYYKFVPIGIFPFFVFQFLSEVKASAYI